MNRFSNIAVAIAVSCFLATNFYLLFSEKSVIPKSLHVHEYERMTAKDYSEKLSKKTLVAPLEKYTVYVKEEEAVNAWLVWEGHTVTVGQELALLNTDYAESERELWEAEHKALLQQQTELNNMITELSSARSQADSNSTSNVDRQDGVTEIEGRTKIELGLNVGFTVDVTQEGSYSQAVAAVEQQLTDISRQITVVEAQLAQDPSSRALISPVEGIVSNVTRHGSTLSVDIFSTEKVLITYAKDNEWQEVEEGQQVKLQGEGIEEVVEGTILSVSEVPAKDDESLSTYKKLDPQEAKNPLAYYEIRILPEGELEGIPFASNIDATVITGEAFDAVPINEKWLHNLDGKSVVATIIDQSGKPSVVTATTPFSLKKHAIITDGVNAGDIVLYKPSLRDYEHPPHIFLSFPEYMPTKKEWKSYGWRNYLEAMIMK